MYTLGDITLPNPQSFSRKQIAIQTDVVTIGGSTRRDTTRKKEQFILSFQNLTQAEVIEILSEYTKNVAVNFAVAEDNLTIAATSVLINMGERNYLTRGDQYREDITLVLTEV